MSKSKKLTRREFITLAGAATGSAALAACAQPAPAPQAPAPTAVPAAATAVPAAATAVPAAPVAEAPKLGDTLIGKLEGPEIIRDVAMYPKQFAEAPMLADLVKAGSLPALEERLPGLEDVMVVKPLHEVGKYGGTWRRGFTGPADHENGNRIMSTDKILFWDYTGTKIGPALCKDWTISDDGKVTTVYLRKGAKWSDGQPLTADDFMFWYDDVYSNTDLVPTPFPEMLAGGQPGAMKKIDDFTVAFEFPVPNFLFPFILAGSTAIGAGFSTRGAFGTYGGGYAPAHYLKQFLPKYSSEDEVNKKAKDAGFDDWKAYFKNRFSWALNPDLPVMTPWVTTSPINTPTWAMKRNPYYWAVDTDGNQLPYIDEINMTLAENTQVLNLRAVAGDYDIQERHVALGNLPVLLENQEKGNYTIHLDPAFNGSDVTIHMGNAYNGDAEIKKWVRNKDFRHALSLGIDRAQLNETFWLGVGTEGSVAPAESTIYSPGPEWRTKWCTYDPDQANKILDSIGLDKKDAEGFRLRTDNGQRLRLELITVGAQFLPYTQAGEMITQHWKKIGIDVAVKEMERNQAFGTTANSEHQMLTWANDGSEMIFLFPRHALPVDPVECHMGMAFAKWYASGGAQGEEPDDPEMLRAFDIMRNVPTLPEAEQIEAGKELWRIICEQQWSIGTVGQSPAFMGVRVVKNNMGNVPQRQVNAQHARTPGSSLPPTFFFKS